MIEGSRRYLDAQYIHTDKPKPICSPLFQCWGYKTKSMSPKPLYNTIVEVQANFHINYLFRVISRVKCILTCTYIGKSVSNDHLGSSTDLCYIQNCVITNSVRFIKRLRCIMIGLTAHVMFHMNIV